MKPGINILAVWSFASLPMLGWASAALIPLLIHLWTRKRFREVPWAAMQFLLAAMRQHARRIRMEQLLLLAMRMAILVLFGVALSDPKWLSDRSETARGASAGIHHLLVIDVSYSMGTIRAGRTCLDLAKERARDLVNASRPEDGFSLVLLGPQPSVIVDAPSFEPSQMLIELDNVNLRQTGMAISPSIPRLIQIVRSARERFAHLTGSRVTFFSDLGDNSWNEVGSEAGQVELARLSEVAELRLEDVGGPVTENLAVFSLLSSVPLATAGQEVELTAELRNFGPTLVRVDGLRWVIDGTSFDQAAVSIAAGSSAIVRRTEAWSTPGDHLVELHLPDDSLEIDNHRWLCVPVVDQIRGMVIEGVAGSGTQLELALLASESQPAPFVVKRTRSRWSEAELADLDFVILNDLGELTKEDRDRLSGFLQDGGCVLIAVGERTDVSNLQAVLGHTSDGGLLPVRLLGHRAERPYSFSPLEYAHPIVAPFRGHEPAGLLTTPIWKYLQGELCDGARPVLAFDTGDPALVEASVLSGRVLFLATAASTTILDTSQTPPRSWSALATWPSFPPLLQESIRFGVGSNAQGRNVLVGDPLRGRFRRRIERDSATITTPNGVSEPLETDADGQAREWIHDETSLSGVYVLTAGDMKTNSRFAVNVDAREGDPKRYDTDSLPTAFSLRKPSDGMAGAKSQWAERAWFRYLFFAVIGLLVAESWMARRLTAGSARPPT